MADQLTTTPVAAETEAAAGKKTEKDAKAATRARGKKKVVRTKEGNPVRRRPDRQGHC